MHNCLVLLLQLVAISSSSVLDTSRIFAGRGFDLTTSCTRPAPQTTEILLKSPIFNEALDGELDVKSIEEENSDVVVVETADIKSVAISFADDITIGVNRITPPAPFQKSSTLEWYRGQFWSGNSKIYISDITISQYAVTLTASSLSTEFLNDISDLPKTYAETPYYAFIGKYGTHYIGGFKLGGRISYAVKTTQAQQRNYNENGTLSGVLSALIRNSSGITTGGANMTEPALDIPISQFSSGGNLDQLQNFTAWRDSIKESAEPTAFQLESYLPLIESSAIRDNLQLALTSYFNHSISYESGISLATAVKQQTDFEPSWTSNRFQPEPVIVCWTALIRDGFLHIGEQCKLKTFYTSLGGSDFPASYLLKEIKQNGLPVYEGAPPLLATPTSFEAIWFDTGSGAIMDGSAWYPSCPAGYYPLGSKIWINYSFPPASGFTCVHSRCVVPCPAGDLIWDSTEPDTDVSFWTVGTTGIGEDLNTVVVFPRVFNASENVPSDNFFCLAKTCVADIMFSDTYTAQLGNEIQSLWTQDPLVVVEILEDSPDDNALVVGLIVGGVSVVCVAMLSVAAVLLIRRNRDQKRRDLGPSETELVPLETVKRVEKGHTIIEGKYALLNKIRKNEAEELEKQTGIAVIFASDQTKVNVVLGKGQFGKIRLARNVTTGKFAGVKKVKGNSEIADSMSEAAMQRLLDGIPNVMPLLDSVETVGHDEEPVLYHFMPLAGFGSGELLAFLLFQQAHHLKERVMTQFAKDLLTGMKKMHQRRVYHLDLKPGNVVIDHFGTAYIIDFGCAVQMKDKHQMITPEVSTNGDTRFFSPDRMAFFRFCMKTAQPAEIRTELDGAMADSWALGMTLLECYLGVFPLPSRNVQQKLQHWNSEYYSKELGSISELDNPPEDSICAVIKGLLAIDPTERLTARKALKMPVFDKEPFESAEQRKEIFASLKLQTTKQEKDKDVLSASGYRATTTEVEDVQKMYEHHYYALAETDGELPLQDDSQDVDSIKSDLSL